MANPKKSVVRSGVTINVNAEPKQRNARAAGVGRDSEAEVEQQDVPTATPSEAVPDHTPGPAIFAEPVPYDAQRRASPLFATAVADFDPTETRPQLAEFWRATPRLGRNGNI